MRGLITLKGKGGMTTIVREISWRRTRHGWKYDVAHLPAEANIHADALSRLAAPDAKKSPRVLANSRRLDAPSFDGLWVCDKPDL